VRRSEFAATRERGEFRAVFGDGLAERGGEDAVGRPELDGIAFEEEQDAKAADVAGQERGQRPPWQTAGSVRSAGRVPALVSTEKVARFSGRPQGLTQPSGAEVEAPGK
jgi:hypothetical protein